MADIIAETLVQMKNAEKIGRSECITKKVSNLLREVLGVMKKEGYIGEFEVIDDGRGGILKVQLLGKLNNAGAIKPRFSVTKDNFEKFEKRYLPAKDFGIIIVTTTKGVMTHIQAKKAGIGCQLLAYVY
jgi:small subunit ribosomal protein S8